MPDGRFIKIMTQVVEAYIPLLFDMEVMARNKLLLDFYKSSLLKKEEKCKITMVMKYENEFIQWMAKKV